ncbi:hypothetical protein NQ804_04405 [Acinetobacter baumannii]|nr:hypothetical protein [Acinetobacter baumannii]
MKIAYLGGFKDGQYINIIRNRRRDNVLLEVVIEHEDMQLRNQLLTQQFSGKPVNLNDSMIQYNLMTIKRNGEFKYFYVMSGLERQEVEKRVNEHWDKSSITGYEF